MNFKKTLQGFLVTSALLSSVCAHGMDDGTVDRGETRKPPAAKTADLTFSDLPAEIAPIIFQFLDTQSFGRFSQVNKIFQDGAQRYLDGLPKGQALIDHLKKMPAEKMVSYLGAYARHDLHAADHFLDAFYKYCDLPRKERLFFIHGKGLWPIYPQEDGSDFTQQVASYMPYGMCLIVSYCLNPSLTNLQYRVAAFFQNQIDQRFSDPEVKNHSYIFFFPNGATLHNGENVYSQAAIDFDLHLRSLLYTPEVWAREESKAFYLGQPAWLKSLLPYRLPYRFNVEENTPPDLFKQCMSLETLRADFLQEKDNNLLKLEAFEKKITTQYSQWKNIPSRDLLEGTLGLWQQIHSKLSQAYEQQAFDFFKEASTLIDPEGRAAYFKQTSLNFEKMLQKKGDAATELDYENCRNSYLNVAQAVADPGEKEAYLKRALFYCEKILQAKADLATNKDYWECGELHYQIALNLADPREQATHFKRTLFYFEKWFQRNYAFKLDGSGDNFCIQRYLQVAHALTDPVERARHFKQWSLYQEKFLQDGGDFRQPMFVHYENCGARYLQIGQNLADPAEKVVYFKKAVERYEQSLHAMNNEPYEHWRNNINPKMVFEFCEQMMPRYVESLSGLVENLTDPTEKAAAQARIEAAPKRKAQVIAEAESNYAQTAKARFQEISFDADGESSEEEESSEEDGSTEEEDSQA